MLFLLITRILCIDRIKLKIVGDDKFLGMSGEKIVKVDYRDALPIKLNTMKDITEKALENKHGQAVTETGFWFFPKSYVFKKNKMESKQAFRIVFYGPNEYILMKGDNCLGFRDDSKFKRVDCREGKATKFKMCTNRLCDSYLDLKKDLECIKGFLGMGGFPNRGAGGSPNPYQYPFNGSRHDDESSSDSSIYNGRPHRNGRYPGGGRGRHGRDYSDDNYSESNDMFSGCKELRYGIPGYAPSKPKYSGYQPLYNRNDRSGFPYSC